MKKKIFFLAIATIAIFTEFIVSGIRQTKDRIYTGTKIEFSADRTIQIDKEEVTFEAASSEFFVLQKVSGETITGTPALAPLGWPNDKYFTYGPEEITGGTWLFPVGNATVRITSDSPVTVRSYLTAGYKVIVWVASTIVAFLIWASVIVIFTLIFTNVSFN